jgi:hypothetical protein
VALGKTTFLANKILDLMLGQTAYDMPDTLYVALFVSAPSDAGGGTEVSGGSYARIAVTNDATNFPAASGGSKSNATPITFAAATANWGTVTHMAIFDALSGGNMLFVAALIAPQTINTGGQFSFVIGDLTFTED